MKNFIFKILLRWHKQKAVFEMQQDIAYMHMFKHEDLKYDENKGRKRMAELKAKEERTPAEEKELEQVIAKITNSKGTKESFNGTTKTLKDVQEYLSML